MVPIINAKAGHWSKLASLRFCVIAATGRRKQTQTCRLVVDYATLSNNLRISDQLRQIVFAQKSTHLWQSNITLLD